MKYFILFFLCLLTVEMGLSQENFVPATLVGLGKKEVEGYVDYQDSDVNPKEFVFKKKLTNKQTVVVNVADQTYSEVHVRTDKEYVVYCKRYVQKNNAPQEQGKLTERSEPIMVADTLFLRLLESGDVNLYVAREADGKVHYFVEGKKVPIVELIYQQYIFLDKGNSMIKYKVNEYFKKQLLDIMASDKDNVKEDIESIVFEQRTLRSLIGKYNKGKPNSNRYSNRLGTSTLSSEWGASFGMSINSGIFNYQGASVYDEPLGGNTTPFIAIFNDSEVFKSKNRFFLHNELQYRTYSIAGETTLYKYFGNNISNTIVFDNSSLVFVTGVKYRLGLTPSLDVDILLGIENKFLLSGYRNFFTSSGSSFAYLIDRIHPSEIQQGLVVGMDLHLNRWGLNMRYDATKYDELGTVLIAKFWTLGVGYKF